MKKIILLMAIAGSAAGSSGSAQGVQNLFCSNPAGNLHVSILWGQGTHSPDVTTISSPTGKKSYFSGYSVTPLGSNQAQLKSMLVDSSTGKIAGAVQLTENSVAQSVKATGALFIPTPSGKTAVGLTCTGVPSLGVGSPLTLNDDCFHTRRGCP